LEYINFDRDNLQIYFSNWISGRRELFSSLLQPSKNKNKLFFARYPCAHRRQRENKDENVPRFAIKGELLEREKKGERKREREGERERGREGERERGREGERERVVRGCKGV
jgi:hypothetical protein